jgi:hypothetical protein
MTGTEPHARETGPMVTITYVGLDVHRRPSRSRLPRAVGAAAGRSFRNPSQDSNETGGAAGPGRPSPELLLRGRPLRLRVAPIADRLWT